MRRSLCVASTLLLTSALTIQTSQAQLGATAGVIKHPPQTGADPLTEATANETYEYRPGWENTFEIKGESGIPGLKRLPRIDGSTTAIPLAQLIVARTLNLKGEFRRLPVRRSAEGESLTLTFPHDTPRERLEEYSNLWAGNKPQSTHTAYDSMTRQDSSLILVARGPSPDELKLAAQQEVEFDVRPVALDAFVFIVNSSNPVSNLSLDQIRGIYTGKITNWKELGGPNQDIMARTRDRNSGSEELMTKLVMGKLPMIAGGDRMSRTMGSTLDAIVQHKNAIAYSVYYYERVMYARSAIKPLAINGVVPVSKTIADNTYPLVEPVYVVTRKDIAPDGPTATLRDWLLSDEGQKLIAQSGYVPYPKK